MPEEHTAASQPDPGLQVALAEYNRRALLVQVTVARMDQSLTLLIGGLAVLASAEGVLFAGLWTAKPLAFYWGTSFLSAAAAAFSCAILVRDAKTRLVQTRAEQAQARLRNYFVSLAPEIRPYLSDTIHDDWPTPYSAGTRSFTYRAWLAIAALAGACAGLSCAAALATSVHHWWIVAAAGVAVTAGVAGELTRLVRRWLRKLSQAYTPLFPGFADERRDRDG
ncbi:hypothetical protein LV75_005772 [Actinokineospora diospyrosa]|uniref:Uncharacterized protein n=1 Tax=Actinokineospora diospyrosa TaxID=103728 RepID=A0ABT1IL63_9PSEU|nr:hypothetical protein [Actinokineospora diospyrosa]